MQLHWPDLTPLHGIGGLMRQDLAAALGSRAGVSEILSRRRYLTLPIIRNLRELLDLPADFLVRDYRRQCLA